MSHFDITGRSGRLDAEQDGLRGGAVIFITAKFRVKPEDAESWPDIAAEFTQATRSEPGCLWSWSQEGAFLSEWAAGYFRDRREDNTRAMATR